MTTIDQLAGNFQTSPENSGISGFLANFDSAVTEERLVVGGQIHETVRLSSPMGDSVARVEWRKEWGPLVSSSEPRWKQYNSTPETYMLGAFSVKKKHSMEYLTGHDFGPVADALGFHHGTYGELDSGVVAEAWVIPSPERVNNVLQNRFGRTTEGGFPELVTFRRENGSSGLLTAKEFFEEIVAGRLPISSEADVPQRLHDTLVHVAYAVLPASLFQFIKSLAEKELATEQDWGNLPKGSSAAVLMESFDSLTARISGFMETYNQGKLQNHQNLSATIASFLEKVVPGEEGTKEAADSFAQETLDGISDMLEKATA